MLKSFYFLSIFLGFFCRLSYVWTDVVANKRPQNPCPNLFNYVRTDSGTVGKVTVNFVPPGVHRIKVGFSQTPEIETTEGSEISLYHTQQILEGRLKRGEPISFRVIFPTPGVLPKLTLISFNNAILCRGSAYPPPSSSFELETSLTYSGRRPNKPTAATATATTQESSPPPPPATTTTTTTTRRPTITTTTTTRTSTQQPLPSPTEISPSIPDNVKSSNPFLQTAVQQATTNCGREGVVVQPRVVPLILGGHNIGRGQFPWLAAIKHLTRSQQWTFKCGGALVSDRAVLTAAHCLHDATFTTVQVRVDLGRHDIDVPHEDAELYVPTEKVVLHPDYRKRNLPDADIGLVLLQQTVQFTPSISPICLWSGPNDLNHIAGNMGVVVGWGIDESGFHSSLAKMIAVPVVSELECRQSHPVFFNLITDRTLCAGKRDGTGPLEGDSGGALMMKRGDRWALRGIVSVGLNKNRNENYTFVVYCDVAKFTTWIESEIEEFS